jgi:hypothetical protein
MSYICDVCGPRLDCHSILCNNCDIGIIYEINTKDAEVPGQTSDVSTGKDTRKPPISRQKLSLN